MFWKGFGLSEYAAAFCVIDDLIEISHGIIFGNFPVLYILFQCVKQIGKCMFEILFLLQRITQKNIGACKPGIAGIFSSCLPVFLIDSGSKGFRNDGVFLRKIIVVLWIGVILFQFTVCCFDNKFYFFFYYS